MDTGLDELLARRTPAIAALAREARLPVVATGNVHLATPAQRRLAQAMAAIRARRSLAEMDGWLDVAGSAFLRSGEEMQARFERFGGAVARSVANEKWHVAFEPSTP